MRAGGGEANGEEQGGGAASTQPFSIGASSSGGSDGNTPPLPSGPVPSPTSSPSPPQDSFYVEGGDNPAYFVTPTLGRFFLKFLRFYGEEFTSPQTTCLDAASGSVFPMVQGGDPSQGGAGGGGGGTAAALAAGIVDPVNIPDPIDRRQNVGRNCFRWFQVATAFREARRSLLDHAASNPPQREALEALQAALLSGGGGRGGLQWGGFAPSAQAGPGSPNSSSSSSSPPSAGGVRGGPFPFPSRAAALPPWAFGRANVGGATAEGTQGPEFPLLSLIIAAVKGL
jgi:hypothetical protein